MERVVAFVVVAAAGLILLADMMGAFERGVADTKEAQADALIAQLRAAVVSVYSRQADLGDNADLVPNLVDLKKVPENALNADGDGILHPYGGEVTILGNDERFAITLADMDDDQCGRAAAKMVGGTGVVDIEVADAAPDEVNDDEQDEDLTVDTVIDACAEGGGANFLTITFR